MAVNSSIPNIPRLEIVNVLPSQSDGCNFLFFAFAVSACKTSQQSKSVDKDFVKIFDGKTLNNWEGDSVYWRVEGECMVGEITAATIRKRNSFIIWRGGVTNDFELRVEYKVTAGGNSGIAWN